MKFLLSITLTTSIAVAVALILSQGGYITFWWNGWRVDVAISTFLIFLFLVFVVFWFISKILFEIFSLPAKAKKYKEKVKESKKVESVFKLFSSYFKENYLKVISDSEKIHKNFKLRHNKGGDLSIIVDYLTAIAADKVGNSTLRDVYIEQIESDQKQTSNSHIFVDILKIQTLLKSKKLPEAVSFVSKLQKKHANNLKFLKLQLRVNEAVGNWEEVLRLSRITEKKIDVGNFDSNYYKYLSIENMLKVAGKNPVSIKKVIGLIKNDYKKDAKLTYMLSSSYMTVGKESKARDVLEEFLDKSWNKSLLDLFICFSGDPKASLKKFAEWDQRFSEHYEFQLNLGKVCGSQKLWGKAQQHYEKSIELSPSVEAFVRLAEIFKIIKDEEAAISNWKNAAYHSLKTINSSKRLRLEE